MLFLIQPSSAAVERFNFDKLCDIAIYEISHSTTVPIIFQYVPVIVCSNITPKMMQFEQTMNHSVRDALLVL